MEIFREHQRWMAIVAFALHFEAFDLAIEMLRLAMLRLAMLVAQACSVPVGVT